MFLSAPQSCTVACADGSPFTFTVPAGLFTAKSQILADREAHTYACRQASFQKICLNDLEGNGCVGKALSLQLTTTGIIQPAAFFVSSGALPPGTTLSPTGLISGTCTTAGLFSFSIRVVSVSGSFMVKNYNLAVLDITTSSTLNPYIVGTVYSQQLAGVGGTAPYTFTVDSGALPAGLTLSQSGLISGTPLLVQTLSLAIKIEDSTGASCTKQFTITGSALVGFQICNWSTVLAALTGYGACPASALPPWDGLFDKSIIGDVPVNDQTIWYFIGKSIGGRMTSADQTPDYPINDWQDNDCYTSLSQDFIGGWNLVITCTDCIGTIWQGSFTGTDPNDPTGLYNKTGGASAGPATIRIVPVSDESCCVPAGEDITIPVPATADIARGLPQPTRVRIQNFNTVLPLMGNLNFCHAATTEPAWDGTWPVINNGSPGQLNWKTESIAACNGGTYGPLSLSGRVIQNTALNCPPGPGGSCFARLNYDGFDGPCWQILILCVPPNTCAALPTVWQGSKRYGTDPTGTYTRENTNGSSGVGLADGPHCIHIESY